MFRKMPVITLLFLLVVLLHVLPIWAYDYFATEDGPSHLHNSAVLLDFFAERIPIFHQYYELQPTLAGNMVSQLGLIALKSVAPTWLAHKLFLSGYVVLICLGFWYAVGSIRRDAMPLAFLIFPFVYSSWLHMGLYNFCLGMALSLFVFGYFIRHQGNFSPKQTTILMLLFLILYFTHIVALGAVALAVTVLSLTAVVLANKGRRSHDNSLPEIGKRHLVPLVAIVPSALMVLFYLGEGGRSDFTFDGLRIAAWRIYSVAPIASTSDGDYTFGKAVAALVAVIGSVAVFSRRKEQELRLHDGLVVAAIVFLVMTITVPDTVGDGTYIRMRLIFYFYFALIFWIAAQPLSKTILRCSAGAAVLISALLFVSRASAYAELDRQVTEYMSAAPWIDPDTTLLSLSFASWGYEPTQKRLVKTYLPFEHISGLLAADKGVVDLGNYEANLHAFWTRFRPQLNPFRFINGDQRTESRPLATNLFGYPPGSGGRVDYVLLWGFKDDESGNNQTQNLRHQLSEAYDLIYVSQERRLVQLYRRKQFPGGSAGMKY